MVVSNIFNFHSYFGKIPILTNIFQMGWFNHQLDNDPSDLSSLPCFFFGACFLPEGSEGLNFRVFEELLGGLSQDCLTVR